MRSSLLTSPLSFSKLSIRQSSLKTKKRLRSMNFCPIFYFRGAKNINGFENLTAKQRTFLNEKLHCEPIDYSQQLGKREEDLNTGYMLFWDGRAIKRFR